MRLDGAVFVRPAPKVPSMPTRRAFVIAGCTFAAGIAVGGACGYSAGVAAGAGRDPASEEIPTSGDAELDELRRLAVKAPIDELLGQWMLYLSLMSTTYRSDDILWQGIDRMCSAVLAGSVPDGRRIALALRGMIERGEQRFAGTRAHLMPELAKVR